MDLDTISRDIAALHKICRFNGHVHWHYSVAEHTAHGLTEMVLRDEPVEKQRLFAVHDLPEAMLGLGDITNPRKHAPEMQRVMREYVRPTEQRYLLHLGEFLGLELTEAVTDRVVKMYDSLMSTAELHTVARVPLLKSDGLYDPNVHGGIADRILQSQDTPTWNLWAHFARLFPQTQLRRAA